MLITAQIKNSFESHEVQLFTDNAAKRLYISHKAGGYGSAVNGGELLLAAIATCFCNDIYREAARRHLVIRSVEVNASAEFEKEAVPAKTIAYEVKIESENSKSEIQDLVTYVDSIAEIHNTIRLGTKIVLKTS